MEEIPPYLNFKIRSSCDLWKKDDVMWNNWYGVPFRSFTICFC